MEEIRLKDAISVAVKFQTVTCDRTGEPYDRVVISVTDKLNTPTHYITIDSHQGLIDGSMIAYLVDNRERDRARIAKEQGKDYEDQITLMASDYGVSVPEMKQVLLQSVFPSAVSAQQPDEQSEPEDDEDE